MEKIGILGGTFDPPHIGHLLIATEVKHVLGLDEIWFIPTYEAPHKDSAITSADKRVKMLNLALQDEIGFIVNTIEVERKGKSYTIDTVTELQDLYPNVQFHFIIGADMVSSLASWKDIHLLVKKVNFVGVGRLGFALQTEFPIQTVPVPYIDISSTEIRNRIYSGAPFKFMLPENVYSFIKEQQLYGFGNST